ncbi:MBL fold metallo-hydrolase [bacterium]|nr:MBL fold metallo-hydrolase [bacterium]
MTDTPQDAPPEAQLEIRIIPVTPLQQNCSLIWDRETKHAAFVDPGGDIDQLMKALEHFGLTLKHIWLTHGHLDHAGAAQALKERTGAPIEGPHRDDQWLLDAIEEQGAKYGITDGRNCTPDRYLEDGDTLELEGVTFGVAHCPGHTPGHVVIHNAAAQIAFVGDVLFAGSIGRTDFPRGNHQQLIDSITGKLWPLGEDMRFVPGHGPMSTFGQERKSNPFVADRITGFGGAAAEAADQLAQRLSKRWS